MLSSQSNTKMSSARCIYCIFTVTDQSTVTWFYLLQEAAWHCQELDFQTHLLQLSIFQLHYPHQTHEVSGYLRGSKKKIHHKLIFLLWSETTQSCVLLIDFYIAFVSPNQLSLLFFILESWGHLTPWVYTKSLWFNNFPTLGIFHLGI